MPYDERLAGRVREALAGHPAVVERKMFGGLAFMLGGNMCCGVVGDRLMVRVGPQGYDKALAEAGARPMDFTGRPLRGLVYVDATVCGGDEDLRKWVSRGADFAMSLPPK